MPIYEYACKHCGHTFDVLQKMHAELLTECPECGKPELKKLLSAPNFRLKGGGWYETDFKDKNRRNVVDAPESKSASGAKDSKKAPEDSSAKARKEKDSGGKAGKEKDSGSKAAKE